MWTFPWRSSIFTEAQPNIFQWGHILSVILETNLDFHLIESSALVVNLVVVIVISHVMSDVTNMCNSLFWLGVI